MRILFDWAAYLYGGILRGIAPLHPKARQIVRGRRETLARMHSGLDPDRPVIWMHVASLGEFEQGRPILETLRAEHPGHQILLSFFSPSGYNKRHDYAGADAVVYYPLDTKRRVREFLNEARPQMAIFVKYDLWPTMLHELHKRDVPIYLVSAIFRSDQLFFQPWGRWYLTLLKLFDYIFVQDSTSASLLRERGIDRMCVAGDTRFDRVLALSKSSETGLTNELTDWASAQKHLLVAGSTWPKDEELLVAYLNTHPELSAIIAPHEPSSHHLEALTARLDRPYTLLSQWLSGEVSQGSSCLIVDTIGHLSKLYSYGQIAYIGGGFGRGIHNTLEAAAYGLPVIMGPHMHKFREASDLIKQKAAFVITDLKSLGHRLDRLISDEAYRSRASRAAKAYVQREAGATERIVALLSEELRGNSAKA